MLRHLRLARSRGSLVAPNHPVQDRALEILEILDEIDKEKSRVDRVKALLTNQFSTVDLVKAQFPEYFRPEDPFEEAKTEDGGYDIDRVDESKLDWGTPASPDDDDEISRWIAQQETGSISAADMDEYDNN